MELLGREQERAALGELVVAARQGRGGALVLRGEPGVGLTALVEHAVRSASDIQVARVRGVRPERDVEFAALHQLCGSMLDRLDALPTRQRDTLAGAFGLAEGRVEDGLPPGLAVLALLSRTAQEQPLLCVVDDAQWLDAPSAEAVAFAARRSERQRIAFAIAVHEPGAGPASPFAGIDEREVAGLPPDVAGTLLASALSGPLDAGVRDRLIADTAGNPLALLQLSTELTPEQLAGLAALPPVLPLGDALRARFLGPVRDMPADTQRLLVLAAADPDATSSVLWSAAATLGLSADAAAPAEAAGVLRLGRRIRFRHPLVRLAVYDAAPVAERQRVHAALVDALDPELESDRRAGHRAAASLTPDADVAAELEAVAARAKGHGDYGAAADLLERAAGLTPDAAGRYDRTLAAAQSALAAGALARAAALVDSASAAALDERQRAHAQRLRGAIGVALGQGADRPTVLLRAARALEPLEPRLARDTYLEALEGAVCSGRFGSDGSLSETAGAGRSAPPAPASQPSAADPLLDGLALLVTAGHAAAVPTIRRGIEALLAADEPRWLPLGVLAALEIWDDEALHDLRSRQAELTPTATAHTPIPFALSHLGDIDAVVSGRFAVTTTSLGPAELIATAWASPAADARNRLEDCMREAFARELGLHVAFAQLATAVLEIGLGRYEAALSAARAACEEPGLCVVTLALPELIEAAVRAGERAAAVSAVGRLSDRARASGTDWALGMLARSRALLEADARAEQLYLEAIERLRRSRAAPQLARAHLVYGEWLRRARRRREAREQLRTARDMFVFMGAPGFAERARGELGATGEHARKRVDAAEDLLTEHEARIARLVCEGATNAAIAAQLFISPRTVEYHLHKAFRKLGVSSRTQLARVILESDDAPTPQ
jgi:DNA-binding CsgD family transcriptional regulator